MIVDDMFADWLARIGFWNELVRFRVERIDGLLPWDLEFGAKDFLAERMGPDCISVLKKVLATGKGGLSIKNLGLDKAEFDQILKDGECACAVLLQLGLIWAKKTRTTVFLKPTQVVEDPRVRKLIGISAFN